VETGQCFQVIFKNDPKKFRFYNNTGFLHEHTANVKNLKTLHVSYANVLIPITVMNVSSVRGPKDQVYDPKTIELHLYNPEIKSFEKVVENTPVETGQCFQVIFKNDPKKSSEPEKSAKSKQPYVPSIIDFEKLEKKFKPTMRKKLAKRGKIYIVVKYRELIKAMSLPPEQSFEGRLTPIFYVGCITGGMMQLIKRMRKHYYCRNYKRSNFSFRDINPLEHRFIVLKNIDQQDFLRRGKLQTHRKLHRYGKTRRNGMLKLKGSRKFFKSVGQVSLLYEIAMRRLENLCCFKLFNAGGGSDSTHEYNKMCDLAERKTFMRSLLVRLDKVIRRENFVDVPTVPVSRNIPVSSDNQMDTEGRIFAEDQMDDENSEIGVVTL